MIRNFQFALLQEVIHLRELFKQRRDARGALIKIKKKRNKDIKGCKVNFA